MASDYVRPVRPSKSSPAQKFTPVSLQSSLIKSCFTSQDDVMTGVHILTLAEANLRKLEPSKGL